MLRFFRKMRHALIPQGRLTRYFFYAVGEVILVVVGIVIALQVNNWNEDKKLRREESAMLANIDAEFTLNLEKLTSIKDNNTSIYDCTKILKNLIGKPDSEINSHNIDSLFYHSILIADFQPNQFVLSQLKSTDKLKIIRSEKLKRLLYDWDNAMNIKSEAFVMWNSYFMNQLIPYLDENTSIRNMDAYANYEWATPTPLKYNSAKMFSTIQLDNRLENHMWCLHQFSEAIDDLIEIAEKVTRQIEIEIKA